VGVVGVQEPMRNTNLEIGLKKKPIYETNLKKKTQSAKPIWRKKKICETNRARGSAREKFGSFTPILRKF